MDGSSTDGEKGETVEIGLPVLSKVLHQVIKAEGVKGSRVKGRVEGREIVMLHAHVIGASDEPGFFFFALLK